MLFICVSINDLHLTRMLNVICAARSWLGKQRGGFQTQTPHEKMKFRKQGLGQGRNGTTRWNSSSPWLERSSGLGTSGDFPIYVSRMEEVKRKDSMLDLCRLFLCRMKLREEYVFMLSHLHFDLLTARNLWFHAVIQRKFPPVLRTVSLTHRVNFQWMTLDCFWSLQVSSSSPILFSSSSVVFLCSSWRRLWGSTPVKVG